MKKKILIISFSNLQKDPRVYRQISFLAGKYDVTTLGFEDSGVSNVKFYRVTYPRDLASKIHVGFLLLTKRYERFEAMMYRSDIPSLQEERFDLVIVNNVDSLPLALKVAAGAKVLLDAHEYSPGEFDDQLMWRIFWKDYKNHLCKSIAKLAAMTTVCEGIADEYFRNFGVKPEVITNASEFQHLNPSSVSKDRIRMIHHGTAISSRKIELMIELMDYLDERFTLDLMMVPTDQGYHDHLRKLSQSRPKVKFLNPVPMREIAASINRYDVGLYLLPPTNFNDQHALPNKFFEFIQGRLAVAIGPSPEMAKLVNKYDCGIVAKSFDPRDLADELNKLTKDKIEYYKQQSHLAAHELSPENNLLKMEKIVKTLLD